MLERRSMLLNIIPRVSSSRRGLAASSLNKSEPCSSSSSSFQDHFRFVSTWVLSEETLWASFRCLVVFDVFSTLQWDEYRVVAAVLRSKAHRYLLITPSMVKSRTNRSAPSVRGSALNYPLDHLHDSSRDVHGTSCQVLLLARF